MVELVNYKKMNKEVLGFSSGLGKLTDEEFQGILNKASNPSEISVNSLVNLYCFNPYNYLSAVVSY